MNHREQGDMFTEASFGEDMGGIKDEDFLIDFDLEIGNLSVCPPPYQSSFGAADISSLSMVESEVSGADLLSAFDAICVNESLEPKDSVAPDTEADTFDSVGQAYLSSQCPGGGNDNSNSGSTDSAVVAEPFTQGDIGAKVLVDIEKACTQSPSLIVYTSSRRRSARNTKSSQTNKPPKPLKCGRVANKSSEFDLSSLPILRRSRSSFPKRARSSVWGDLGNLLPDIDQSSVLNQNVGSERRQRHEKGGKGKGKGIRDQTGKRSTAKSLVPTGRISLKVKIGNKICSLGNAVENFTSSGKDISGLIDAEKSKLGEEVLKDVSSPRERNLEKVMSSDGPALSSHLHIQGPFYNQSVVTSSNFHETRSLEEGDDNSRGLTDIQCSDVGTSPDSEVINSTPDISLCEKGLPGLQDGPTLFEARVSPMGISNLTLSPNHSKKVKKKKKVKLHQADDRMLGGKLTDADTGSNAAAPISMKARKKTKEARKKDKLCKVDNSGVETNLTAVETLNKANISADLGVSDISDYHDAYKRTEKPYLNGEDMKPSSVHVVTSVVSNSPVCDTLIPCSNGIKFPKCSSGKERSKGRSRNITNEKEPASKNKGNKNDLNGKYLLMFVYRDIFVCPSPIQNMEKDQDLSAESTNSLFSVAPQSHLNFAYLPFGNCKMSFLIFLLTLQEMKHHLMLEELKHWAIVQLDQLTNCYYQPMGRENNMVHLGMHGCFVTSAKNGGGYKQHLLIKLKKLTVDGTGSIILQLGYCLYGCMNDHKIIIRPCNKVERYFLTYLRA